SKGAPEKRSDHTSVASHDQFIIIYGGRNESRVSGGKLYDMKTNQWHTLGTEKGSPTRIRHAAVWADDSMLIFGGHNGQDYLKSGLKYYLPKALTPKSK